jgi:hypothetical protein
MRQCAKKWRCGALEPKVDDKIRRGPWPILFFGGAQVHHGQPNHHQSFSRPITTSLNILVSSASFFPVISLRSHDCELYWLASMSSVIFD